jgi:hypothetical protein
VDPEPWKLHVASQTSLIQKQYQSGLNSLGEAVQDMRSDPEEEKNSVEKSDQTQEPDTSLYQKPQVK